VADYDSTGGKCDECNNLPDRNCNQYACQSLGSNCVWDDTNKKCAIDTSTEFPQLNSISVEASGMDCGVKKEGSSYVIECKAAGGCLLPYTPLKLSYETSKETICKIAFYPKGSSLTADWQNMTNADDQANIFKKSHQWNIPSFMFPKMDLEATAYLVCRDRRNNEITHSIDFCISATDLLPPTIRFSLNDIPINDVQGPALISGKNYVLGIHVNEPVKNCTVDIGGSSTDITEFSIKETDGLTEWVNKSVNFNMPNTPLTITAKCYDLSENVGQYSLTFPPSAGGLKLSIISPFNNTEYTDCKATTSILLSIATNDAEGKPKSTSCYYYNDSFTSYFTGLAPEHQDTLSLGSGSYTFSINCTDVWGESVVDSVTFRVSTNTFGPSIKRLYKDSSSLVLHTDKPASCYYFDSSDCYQEKGLKEEDRLKFGTKFYTSNNLTHSIAWQESPWYVQCIDACGNKGNCTTIYPFEIK
jgi:hypothetical protein